MRFGTASRSEEENVDAVFTPDELAKLLKVSSATIYGMCQSREIRADRVGKRQWRISRKEVLRKWPDLLETFAEARA